MAWSIPKTWLNEVVIVQDMNQYLRDNLLALKYPPSAVYNIQESSNYSTSSTSFVDINAVEGKFLHTITTTGDGNGGNGDVMVALLASVYATTAIRVYFRIVLDGVAQNANDGLLVMNTAPAPTFGLGMASFMFPLRNVSPDTHEIKLQWKVSSGTAILPANAGTSGRDMRGQFFVREMS